MNDNRTHPYRSWAEIDLKRFAQNFREIGHFIDPTIQILQVVKADAYGHGAFEIAKIAIANGAAMLGVANVDEALHLYRHGIRTPILLMGPATQAEIPMILEYNLIPSISDIAFARQLSQLAIKNQQTCPIHLEVDTGMGRAGIPFSQAVEDIVEINQLSHLQLTGIFSHFPASEIPNDPFCYQQIGRFKNILDQLCQKQITFQHIHMANSGGVVFYPEAYFNMVRTGLLTYGQYPGPALTSKIIVQPVMAFKTQVVQIKTIPAGETISYGRTFSAEKEMQIAVLPIGYGDGYTLQLSNLGEVLIRGMRAKIVGRVTMDLTLVDVSHIPSVQVGDEVVLIGQQGDAEITCDDVAEQVNSINYEVLCAVGRRAPRVYLTDETIQTVAHLKKRPDDDVKNMLSNIELNQILENVLQVRLNEELGSTVYRDLLEVLFGENTTPLDFRTHFQYDITIPSIQDQPFAIKTHITYQKTLLDDHFIIGCATDQATLNELFKMPQCEYRELLPQTETPLSPANFKIDQIRVEQINITDISENITSRAKMLTCRHPHLKDKIGQRVTFEIQTQTFYTNPCHHFPVYIVQPIRGMSISLSYPSSEIKTVDVFSFFAGKAKYPQKLSSIGRLEVVLPANTWIFPNSGVLFMWE